jgi:hypothetical protein
METVNAGDTPGMIVTRRVGEVNQRTPVAA